MQSSSIKYPGYQIGYLTLGKQFLLDNNVIFSKDGLYTP